MYRCPKCGETRGLVITASVKVKLFQRNNGEIEGTEPVDSNHEWGHDSPMSCPCGYESTTDAFDPDA